MSKELTLSVHQLVDFLLRSGDIDNRVFNSSSMQEGSRIHSAYQESQDSDYLSEYPLKKIIHVNDVDVTLEGRADGIIKKKNGEYMIDEIKSTVIDLKTFRDENIEWHLGQAKCYAYLFSLEQKLNNIDIRLVYIRQGKEKERFNDYYSCSFSELDDYVKNLIEDYLSFYNIVEMKMEKRNNSIKELKFPFENYRKGQKELAKEAYYIAKSGGHLFVEAPTGIGKTMSTLFPFIKYMGEDDKSKIFYLTAKSSGKEAAYNAIEYLKVRSDLVLNDIVITAKDKICFCKDGACNPDECPYAKGYYTKIQSILRYSLLNYSTFDYDTIIHLAQENMVCPFELELDLSLFCDVIICDYNYLFDPLSYMKRYFDEDASHFLALIDEAHNLVDRSRDMYSSSLLYKDLKEARSSLKPIKVESIKRRLKKLKDIFDELIDNFEVGETLVNTLTLEQYKALTSFTETYVEVSKDYHSDISKELTSFYLEVNRFIRLYELYDEDIYRLYIKKSETDISINLFCVDASSFLKETTRELKASIFFSATLSPIEYYIDTLGGNIEVDKTLLLPSPFPINNFKLIVAPKVSTKYVNREATYPVVKDYIKEFVSNKVGNYFIYSPSYEYMEHLLEEFNFNKWDVDVYIQTREMNERERVAFLENFTINPVRTSVGFLVLGGAFGEGVDLISDRLIGAVVIGTGLPKINFESDLIASYYKDKGYKGHDYAYTNPGMNKVMQAVGRVIRSENDKGAALLIDERYMYRNYQALFRNEWRKYEVVLYYDEVSDILKKFFK